MNTVYSKSSLILAIFTIYSLDEIPKTCYDIPLRSSAKRITETPDRYKLPHLVLGWALETKTLLQQNGTQIKCQLTLGTDFQRQWLEPDPMGSKFAALKPAS